LAKEKEGGRESSPAPEIEEEYYNREGENKKISFSVHP